GLNLKLMDTAGIRAANDMIEQEGIRRSRAAMDEADLILLVLDAHKGLHEEDQWLIEQVPGKKTIVVWNKTDLPHSPLPSLPLSAVVEISAKEKQGLDILRKKIDHIIWENGPPSREEVLITNVRHLEALKQAL